ncbi:MAG: hypothetical protein RLN76_03260 [Phycisphaeraceae bacterium]
MNQPEAIEPTYNGVRHSILTRPATDLAENWINEWNETSIGPEHWKALYATCAAMTEQLMAPGVHGDRKAIAPRVAVPLATGLGKTTCVKALGTVLTKDPRLDHLSIAVSSFQVVQLFEIREHLLAQGVPASKVAIVHSLSSEDANGVPSSTDDEVDKAQIVLITHARVRSKLRAQRVNDSWKNYRGCRRGLLIYDESLLMTDHAGIVAEDLLTEIDSVYYKVILKNQEDKALQRAWRAIEEPRQVIKQLVANPDSKNNTVPALLIDSEDRWDLEAAIAKTRFRTPPDYFLEYLRFAGQPAKQSVRHTNSILVWGYAVDKSIPRVVVLDASFPVRELCRLDEDFIDLSTADEHHYRVLSKELAYRLKTYERVTVHQLVRGSGFGSLFAEVQKDGVGTWAREVKKVIESRPDERFLVFVHKPRRTSGLKPKRLNGVDLDPASYSLRNHLLSQLDEGDRDRVQVTTWGNETGFNSWGEVPNIILCGVVQPSGAAYEAGILAQSKDPSRLFDKGLYARVRTSEKAHRFFQALSRGRSRKVDRDGRARSSRAWLIDDSPDLQSEMLKVMPGAEWVEWEPEFYRAGRRGAVTTEAVRKITPVLREMPPGGKLSSQALKEQSGLKHLKPVEFSRCLTRVLAQSPSFSREGRSVVRRD